MVCDELLCICVRCGEIVCVAGPVPPGGYKDSGGIMNRLFVIWADSAIFHHRNRILFIIRRILFSLLEACWLGVILNFSVATTPDPLTSVFYHKDQSS